MTAVSLPSGAWLCFSSKVIDSWMKTMVWLGHGIGGNLAGYVHVRVYARPTMLLFDDHGSCRRRFWRASMAPSDSRCPWWA